MSVDVIIVGAGPAGSTLAYTLANRGLQVLLLEKEVFPRPKTCGGALDGFFAKSLPIGMDVSEVTEARVDQSDVRYRGHRSTYTIPRPIALTQRLRLDEHLVEQARAAGAKLNDDQRVDGLERENGMWTVSAGAVFYKAPIVVGADGAYSTVARLSGLGGPRSTFVASEWDVQAPPRVVAEWSGSLTMVASLLPLGYGWIFPNPTSGILNIGVGLPRRWAKSLKRRTEAFADEYGFAEFPRSESAHQIPFALRGSKAYKDGVLLVGDAAGLADPTTGAGISWSVASAAAAAAIICSAVGHSAPAFDDHLAFYQALYENMLDELQKGMALRNLIITGFAVRGREWGALFEEALACLSGTSTYDSWARSHPWQHRAGSFIQRAIVKRLI